MTAPVAPARTKPRPRECGAGVTPCGAPALLYSCGWRCDPHRPGAARTADQCPPITPEEPKP